MNHLARGCTYQAIRAPACTNTHCGTAIRSCRSRTTLGGLYHQVMTSCFCRTCTRNSVHTCKRTFSTLQRGHDRAAESLYDKLGFAKDNEAHRVRRTTRELQEGLILEATRLTDPEHDPAQRKRLEELKEAYALLQNDTFRANYASHHYSSNDARLHVLQDGGQVAANFNPEHQSFCFVDHAAPGAFAARAQASETSRTVTGAGGASPLASSSVRGLGSGHADAAGSASSSAYYSADVQHSFGDFKSAFQHATGVADKADVRVYSAAAARGAINGSDIPFLLRVSFEESVLGCTKTIAVQKNVSCARCEGAGTQRLKKPRRCPQCMGRGNVHLPSATYHIERVCNFCAGDGTAAPPRCTTCAGRGVLLGQSVQLPVSVPPGTTSMSVFRLPNAGHDGVRGGRTGCLTLTVMVGEHRFFHRDGYHLHAMLPIPLSTALLGGVVSVPTLHGPRPLRVPPCVANGQVLTLVNHGVMRKEDGASVASSASSPCSFSTEADGSVSGAASGNLYYHVLVLIPTVDQLSGRQKEMLGVYESTVRTDATPAESNGVHGEESGSEEEKEEEEEAEEREDEAEKRLRECAELKQRYNHWLRS